MRDVKINANIYHPYYWLFPVNCKQASSVSSHGTARFDLSKVKKLLHNRKVSTVLIYSASIFPSSVSGSKTAITAHT